MAKRKNRSIKIIEFFDRLNQYQEILETTWAEMGPEKAFQELQDKYDNNPTVMKGIVDRQLGRANKIKDPTEKQKSLDVIEKIQKLLSEKGASSKGSSSKDSDSTDDDEEIVSQARIRAAKHVSKENYDEAIDATGGEADLKTLLARNMEREKQKPEDGIDAASGHVAGALHETKETAFAAGKVLGVSDSTVREALKDEETHGILQSVGYSLKKLGSHIHHAQKAYDEGLDKVFSKAGSTRLGEIYHSGVKKADEILEKVPTLKKLTGPVVAGGMFLMWSHQFTLGAKNKLDSEHLHDSLDQMKKAARGDYKLNDFIGPPDGLRHIAQCGMGIVMGAGLHTVVKSTGQVAALLVAKKVGNHDWFKDKAHGKHWGKLGDIGIEIHKMHGEASHGLHALHGVAHAVSHALAHV
jgi:hypothetical protein